MSAFWFRAATLLSFCILISTEDCSSIEQPDGIDVTQQGDEWIVTFRYPAVNFNVNYKCPNNNRQGSLHLVATVLSETAADRKELYYEGVPGSQLTGILKQSVPDLEFDVFVHLDNDGFVFTGICYIKKSKETKKWSSDTKTPKDFPFFLNDSGQLRFDLNKCNIP